MGKMAPVLAAGTVALLFSAALILGSGPNRSGGCTGTASTATATAARAPIAGYSSDQLANAATIINTGSALHVPAAAITIAVMTAMGESGLRNLTYGDAAGPDSRGLFQQRDSWGSLAARLNPGTAAAAFFRHLLAVPGWRTMTPTLAAHAVQRNAVADYYTPYWNPAQHVVHALTGGAAACAADLVPTADATALAGQLETGIRAGTITGLVPDHLREITWMAEHKTVPGCGVDTRILQVIQIAWHLFGRVGISDINRHCTGQLAGAGTESSHWIHGGGEAVDFYSLGGIPTTGADSAAIRLLAALDPVMPIGARAGQAQCRAPDSPALTHLIAFDDTCNHLHLDVAYTTGQLAASPSTSTTLAVGRTTLPVRLAAGADLRTLLRAAGDEAVQLAAGTYTFDDFSSDQHGVDLPVGGLIGAGSGSTILGMTAHTSTKAGQVPTEPLSTNPLNLLALKGGSPKLSGFTLAATDQNHLYNGLRVTQTHNLQASDIEVDGIPGSTNYPPEETFAINDWRTSGSVWSHITVDAQGVGAAGFGANNSNDLTIRDSTFTGTAHSAGLALWQSSDLTLDHVTVSGNQSGINFERDSGTIALIAPRFADNDKWDLQFMTDGPPATVTITDPVLPAGKTIRIRIPPTYRGSPEGQDRSRIRVLVNGIDQTRSLVTWTA